MGTSVPVHRTSYVSTSAEEAWDVLSRMYTGARPHTGSLQAAVRFDAAETPGLAVDHGHLSAAQGAFDPSPDQLNIISVLDGRISLDFGRRGAVISTAGDSYLYLPDGPADLRWDDFEALPVRVPLSEVTRSAAAQTGIPADALRFTSPRPRTPGHAQLWLRTARLLRDQLADPHSSQLGTLVHRGLINLTAATLLEVFPNTAMTRGYIPGPGDVRPAAIRRAVAYIDTHVSLPITVTDIADAAGTTPRALRAAFRRHLDTTPTAYLRRARLEAARADLSDLDQHTHPTVAEVAWRWGYTHPNHFIADYTATYGAPPDTAA